MTLNPDRNIVQRFRIGSAGQLVPIPPAGQAGPGTVTVCYDPGVPDGTDPVNYCIRLLRRAVIPTGHGPFSVALSDLEAATESDPAIAKAWA